MAYFFHLSFFEFIFSNNLKKIAGMVQSTIDPPAIFIYLFRKRPAGASGIKLLPGPVAPYGVGGIAVRGLPGGSAASPSAAPAASASAAYAVSHFPDHAVQFMVSLLQLPDRRRNLVQHAVGFVDCRLQLILVCPAYPAVAV